MGIRASLDPFFLSLWAEETPQSNASTVLSPRTSGCEGSPQISAGTEYSLSIQGEGWGEGEHTAVVVIPFTLRALLL